MKHILYTTEEGGEYKYTKSDSDEDTVRLYNNLRETGEIAFKTGDYEPIPQKLAFIMLLEEIDHWDFILANIPSRNGNGKQYETKHNTRRNEKSFESR